MLITALILFFASVACWVVLPGEAESATSTHETQSVSAGGELAHTS
jgi:hypothetical protein